MGYLEDRIIGACLNSNIDVGDLEAALNPSVKAMLLDGTVIEKPLNPRQVDELFRSMQLLDKLRIKNKFLTLGIYFSDKGYLVGLLNKDAQEVGISGIYPAFGTLRADDYYSIFDRLLRYNKINGAVVITPDKEMTKDLLNNFEAPVPVHDKSQNKHHHFQIKHKGKPVRILTGHIWYNEAHFRYSARFSSHG